MVASQQAIKTARFRNAFRGAGGAANLPADAPSDFIIDQFNHDHLTGAEAGAAFNNG